jgi:hypothetical protein
LSQANPGPFTGVVSLRERSLNTERKKGSISYTKLQTLSVKKKATRLAANALPIPIDKRGEIYSAVLLASIDVADYRLAWNATQHVISKRKIRIFEWTLRIFK